MCVYINNNFIHIDILEKILPYEFAICLFNFDRIPLKRWIRLQKAKRKKFSKMVDRDKSPVPQEDGKAIFIV